MIRLESVTKRYPNGQLAVDGLSLEVAEGEVCVLVGPSGCGKTTTMKMINRLVEPTSGRILLDGEDVTRADPIALRRRIGYVIQQVGLFPHMSVAENVATVPRLLGWDRHRIAERVEELLELVGLPSSTFAKRYPPQLSGGQQQRVGVARALGADPPLLLMDEPFGAIDPVTRERLQQEFLRLQAEVRKTVVFVTHDVDEAVRLGDRIAVLRQGGVLEQYDEPAQVLGRPATPFVADFLGADRVLKRLGVLGVDLAQLEHPPTMSVEATLAEVKDRLEAEGADWILALDGAGGPMGYLERAAVGQEGAVREWVRPLSAKVDIRASLKDAFSAMLLGEVGWVIILDGDRYLGVLTARSLQAATRLSPGTGPISFTTVGF